MNPTAGSVQYNVSINTSGLAGQIGQVNSQLGNAGQQGAAGFGAKFGAVAGITQSVFNKALSSISSSVDGAVSRVDTLNNSNRVFANMGFSAADTKSTMDNLTKSIQGLPTPLDSAVKNVQLLAGSTGNLGKSQEVFAALNNGILGFGGTTDMVNNSMVQLSQAFANGKVDAETWNSMMDSGLGPTLNALAKQMGMTTGELKKGLSEGTVSVEAFQDGLIKLNKEGGGGLTSLEQIAKDSTAGIGTGMSNMQTAISRGLASIIESIGSENISAAIAGIGSAMESTFKVIASVIGFISEHKDIFAPIAVGIGAIVAAMALWNAAVSIATTIQTIYNAVLAANPIGIILLAIIGVTAALIYFFTQTELGKAIFENFGKFVSGVWDAIMGAINFVWNWLKENWPLLLAILTGPIGVAVLLIVKHWDTIKAAFAAAWEWIKGIWSGVAGWFGDVWNGIVRAFSNVGNWFRDAFNNAWNNIKNAFSGVTGFFQGIWNSIIGIFTNIGNAVGGAVGGAVKGAVNGALSIAQNAVNGFIDLINGAINLINKIPGVSIGKVGRISLPRLATGGIVTSPTTALIGEAGKEAVLPLENNTGWMDTLASKIGGGAPTTIVVKVGDETLLTKVIDGINDKSMLQGFNAIKV